MTKSTRAELRPEALDHYAHFGWAAAAAFFDASEITQIARFSDEVVAMPEVSGAQMLYREPSLLAEGERVIQRIENFCPYHAGFNRLIHGGRLQSAVEELLGGPAVLFKEKINFKMAGGAGFEPHQDQQAGWSTYAPLFVTALVSIDAGTIENGCLEMAMTPRRSGLIGREWEPLTCDEMAGFALEPVPTAPGDVLFFDSFAPHRSKANLTGSQRRILYLTYNLAADGDHRERYYADKRANFPPDIDRQTGVDYRFRV